MSCGCNGNEGYNNNWDMNPLSTDSCKYRCLLRNCYEALEDYEGDFSLDYLCGREVTCYGANYLFLGTVTFTKCCESYTRNVFICINREVRCNSCSGNNEFDSTWSVNSIKEVC